MDLVEAMEIRESTDATQLSDLALPWPKAGIALVSRAGPSLASQGSTSACQASAALGQAR